MVGLVKRIVGHDIWLDFFSEDKVLLGPIFIIFKNRQYEAAHAGQTEEGMSLCT